MYVEQASESKLDIDSYLVMLDIEAHKLQLTVSLGTMLAMLVLLKKVKTNNSRNAINLKR